MKDHLDPVLNEELIKYIEQLVFEILMTHGVHVREAHRFSQLDTLKSQRPGQSECFIELKESADIDSDFSFHATQSVACENGLAFHTENSAPPTVFVFLTLDAHELWVLERQLKHFADMLTHISIVDFGMKYIQQAQDSSLQILNNPSVLRNW